MEQYVYLAAILITVYLLLHYKEAPAVLKSAGSFLSKQIDTLEGRS